MTGRLIDAMCDRHRRLVLDELMWPADCDHHIRPCADCRPFDVTVFPLHDNRQVAAIHESGHVVLGVASGLTINYVALESSGRTGSTAHWTGVAPDHLYGSVSYVAMSGFGGVAATRYWLARLGHDTDANVVDAVNGGLLDLRDSRREGHSEAALLAGFHRADRMVASYWASIERVADALLAAGRLSGDEVAEIAGLPCREPA